MSLRELRPLIALLGCLAGCASSGGARVAPVPRGDRAAWAGVQLDRATTQLATALERDGLDALLRLRLQPTELADVYTASAQGRIASVAIGVAPPPDDVRWRRFRALAGARPIGFCARGLRFVEARDEEGFVAPALVVDRLLLVLADARDGEHDRATSWGAWIEGLVLTERGWRLRPDVPLARQVEAPRWGHSDLSLWQCDVGHAASKPNA